MKCLKLIFEKVPQPSLKISCLSGNVGYNPEQNIWSKLKELSKFRQGKKNLTSLTLTFYLLLPTFYFWSGKWALDCIVTRY